MDIYIKDLYKNYGDRKVLEIDNIEFKKGSIYAIIGLNGSGKTTLLECVGGLTKPTDGEITYDNLQIEKVKNNISIMCQKPYLFNDSVINNIKFGLKFRRFSEEIVKNRIDKYLPYFEIEHLLNKNAKRLSGGEGAKVAMLRTAVLETGLTLFDEPTASMDIESTLKAEKLLKDISNEDKTIIIITHDLQQAKRVADFVIFMDKGCIIEMGKKEKVLSNPENKLVKLILNI
ncbi:ATP-binding cassette domain-containing protein [uncultured Clostridium sp.]|uniref:energy-coupling factor ABC transporter ATP-binding protein n=1 Tax=uncultured Clostridium sp. TaxID=59620 RepID=UPI0028F0C640|nr:ATP-binding cassette domain-containing protein [uncultured Clostridium sp.]